MSDIGAVLKSVYYHGIFVFDIVSSVLYLAFIVFLIKMLRKSNSGVTKHFYLQIAIHGISDLVYVLQLYFASRFGNIGFVQNFHKKIFPGLLWQEIFISFSQSYESFIYLSGITITLNRLTALLYPMQYSWLWSSFRLILFIGWQYFFGILAMTLYFLLLHLSLIDYKAKDGTLATRLDYTMLQNIWYICVGVRLVCLFITGVLQYYLYKVASGLRKRNSISVNAEIALAKFAQWFFILLGVAAFVEMTASLTGTFQITWLAATLKLVFIPICSLTVFFSMYSVLLINADLRIQFVAFLTLRKVKKLNSISSVNQKSKLSTHQSVGMISRGINNLQKVLP